MALTLFNTLVHKKTLFKPRSGKQVTLYTCGPTVYRSQHIGNYRTFLFEDMLKRILLLNGYRVQHIMNITDVGHLVSDADSGEDKVEKEARREGKKALDVARHFEHEFKDDLRELNIIYPDKFVRASEHISEQIELIKILEKKGYTYKTSDGIYFDTSRLKNYGALARGTNTQMKAGSRVAMKEKRNTSDFALWKFSTPDMQRQMEWTSPWGTGFPGWHIECSAMSMKYLGSTLDIHTGGADHREIHHPNEIAQSETATGKQFSRFWMHGAFLTIKGAKMAKSSPDTNLTLSVLREKGFMGLDFRYLALGTHYRKPLSFSWEALDGARGGRLGLLRIFRDLPKRHTSQEKKFEKEILALANNDLNTPRVLSLARKAPCQKSLLWVDHILGLRIEEAAKKEDHIPGNILLLAEEREKLRKQKQWKEADTIREKLQKEGYHVEDTPQGPAVHRL